MSRYQFSKTERLKSRKAISSLFESGIPLYHYPVKILYFTGPLPDDFSFPVKCGVSVPRRKHRKAVVRNLLKRRMREVYRLNKEMIIRRSGDKHILVNLFIIYLADQVESYNTIEKGIKKCLQEIEGIPELN